MAQNISLPVGVSTFGNSVNADILLSSIDTTGIVSLKTLTAGIWYSWSAGAPAAFQGFLDLKKGLGYVANASALKAITLTGSDLDINTVTYSPGLSMIALPFDNKVIGDGYIPRLKLNSIKTIATGAWKSWSAGAPEAFQGFTTTDKTKGYVVNVETVYGSFLNSNIQNKSEGVRFNTNDINISDTTVTNGVRYTNPNGLGTLSFDTVVFDQTIPTAIMFFNVAGKIAKLDFPTELLGEPFFVVNSGITYTGVFTENENYASPTLVTNTVDNATLELSYTPIGNFNSSTAVYKEMTVNLNGVKSVVEFANEYLGAPFKVWKDGKLGSGVFTAGTVSITL